MELDSNFRSASPGGFKRLLLHVLAGGAVGLAFPLTASLLQIHVSELPFAWSSLMFVQQSEPLLWIIDLAVPVLALAGVLVGRRQIRLLCLNEMLEEKVAERTVELEHALRNMTVEMKRFQRQEEDLHHSSQAVEPATPAQGEFLAGRSHEIAAPERTLRERPNKTEAPVPLNRARILVVDDNTVNRKVATLLLKKLGCSVFVAGNGKEAVELVESDPFDLVLMDCHMPVMDGFEATRVIRAREAEDRRLPILAMTASALENDRQLCFDAGMDDHIAKPVRSEILHEKLSHWLKSKNPIELLS